MDPPDSTDSVSLNFDNDAFGHEPNIQSEVNDNFLDDFFSDAQKENKESIVVEDQLEIDSECDKKKKSSPQSPDSIPLVNEAIMEELKQQNEELKEKTLKQECELAKYEVELSEKMSCLQQVQMERDSIKENLEISDRQRSSLQLKLEEKEAELKQLKALVQKQVSEEGDFEKLKKQMSNDAKLLKKTERDLQSNIELLNKCHESVRFLKRITTKLISTLLEFGTILEQKELLSYKKKKFLEDVKSLSGKLSETSMETIVTNSLSDEENEENLIDKTNTDVNTVNSSYNEKEVNSLPSNDTSLTFTTNTESFSNGFVHSIKSSSFFSVKDDGFLGRTKTHKYAPSPLAEGNKAIPHSGVTCKTEEVAQDKTNRLSPNSNFQSFTLGTESLCSEEDIEITDDHFSEIKKGIKGWVLKTEKFDPLSPLPPSPQRRIRVSHKNLLNKSEKDENSKKCTPISPLSDPSGELNQLEDIQFLQNSSNLKRDSKISENSDHSNSPYNVSSIKSRASTTSLEQNSETLSCKKEFFQSSLLKEFEVTGRSSNNCLPALCNIGQELSPASPEPAPKSIEKNFFSPAYSSTLNEDEKIENISSPLSPVISVNKSITPTSPKFSSEFLQTNDISQTNSVCEKIDSYSFISFPPKTSFSKSCSSERSPVCIQRKKKISPQNSKGFQPHVSEPKKGNTVPNKYFETFVPSLEIPLDLHYLSSTHSENNEFKILHQGNSVYDCLINPETKLSVCVLTVPSKSTSSNQLDSSSLNTCSDNVKLLTNKEERQKRVLTLYEETEKHLRLMKRQILSANAPRKNSNNSLNENSSHIYVVVENESNDSLNCFGDNSTLQDVGDLNMHLEHTASEHLDLKDYSSVNNKSLSDENQSFVSSSCDISTPSKRKLLSSPFKYNNPSGNLSSDQMENYDCKKETDLSVSELTSKKKRLSDINGKLPSKKLKVESQFSSEHDMALNVINSENSVDFSPESPKHSLLNSPVQLQNSISNSSDNNSNEQIASELESKNQTLTNFSITLLTPKKSPTNTLSTNVNNPDLLQKYSSKIKPLFDSNVEIKNASTEMPELPLLSEVNNPQIRLKNSSPENKSLSNFKLLISPSELQGSANDQPIPDINNPLLEIPDSLCEQSVSEINNPPLDHKNSLHHNLIEQNSPSKEIPSCHFNEAQLSRSPSINFTTLDCESSKTPEKSISKSQSISNIVSPKVKHKKSLPKNKAKTNAKSSKHNKLSKFKLNPEKRNRPELKELPSCEPQSAVSIIPSELKGSTNDKPLPETNNLLLEIKDSPPKQSVSEINNTLLEHKHSPHHDLIEQNSPSKEIPSCNFNDAQLSRSPSINFTTSDSENSITPEKSILKSQSISNILSPKVTHKKSLPKNRTKTYAKNSKHNKLSKFKLDPETRNRPELKELPSYVPQPALSIIPSELKGSTNDQPLLDTNNPLLEIKDSPSEQFVSEINNTLLEHQNSPHQSLFDSNNSVVEIQSSPAEMPELPLLSEVHNLQIRLNNSSPENKSLSNSKLLIYPSELKGSANDQPVPDINNPLLEIKDSPCEQSVSEINNTLLDHKNSLHRNLIEQNSPSKEIPSCHFNEAHLSRSPSINFTTLDCESSKTTEKSLSKSPSISNVVSPKVTHKKSLPKNKAKTNSKNSKHNKLSKFKLDPKTRNRPKLKKLLSCELQSTVSNIPSELKGSTNDQPLPDTNNPLFEIKDSPSEKSVSNVNNTQPVSNNTYLLEKINSPSDESVSTSINPELLSKSVESDQFISKEHSFPLDDLNPASNNQIPSPMNNASMKGPLESYTEYQMLDQTDLPSEINNIQSELQKIGSPTSSYVPSICSPLLCLEENSQVIDEQISVEEDIENDNEERKVANFATESQEVSIINGNDAECLEKTIKTDKGVKNSKLKDKTPKSKKKKDKAVQEKKKDPKSFEEEQSLCPNLSIPEVLKQIDAIKILDSLNEPDFKLHAHTLFSALINPSNASSTASVIFQIFNHLTKSKTNPLMLFPFKCDSSVSFPLTERCIVLALIQAESKKENHLKGLKAAAINNLFLFILYKDCMSKRGLSAFCRVFTELCKNSEERKKPVMLCCELIKAKHKFAPILIASVMGVWPELFSPGGQVPEEEIILHSSLAFGLQKKPSSLTSAEWKQCKAVFSKYLLSTPVIDVDETTQYLIEKFEEFLKEKPKEDYYLLTESLLIFAACKGWNWASENLSCFIFSSLGRYAQQREDERAFLLFCNLYADMCLQCPDFESCSEILEQLFIVEGAFDYVRGCTAQSMIKLYLLSKHKSPPHDKFPLNKFPPLCDWIDENQSKLEGTATELWFKLGCMSKDTSFSENDIIAL